MEEEQQPFDEFFSSSVEEDITEEDVESWLSGQAGYLLAGLMLGVLVNLVAGRMGAVQRAGMGAASAAASEAAAAAVKPQSFWTSSFLSGGGDTR